MIGRTISHYKILTKVGEGGMGVVYKATDTKLERPVALKFLAPHAIEDPEHKARFVREAKAAARLDHQNICPIYEIDEVEGQTFLAMAYLEGQTLKDKIAERPLKLDEALDIAIQTAQGLKAAHQNEVVHRDIKPANLMLTAQGQVKIMDFGLAQLADRSRLTKTTTMLGTPAYMSPEQAQRLPTDRRTDVWSLGVVIYEMVTGRLPFEGERQEAILYAIGSEDPEPITALRVGVPMELDRIVGKAMAKDAGERYQHVEEMIVDLKSLRKKLAAGKSTIVGAQRTAPAAAAGTSASPSLTSTPEHAGTRDAVPESVPQRSQRFLQIAISALAGLAIGIILMMGLRSPGPVQQPFVARFAFTPGSEILDPVISPNGRHIVYVAGEGLRKLWIRDLDREQPRELEAGLGAWRPFWSPDSQFIGFAADGDMKKISVRGGRAITLCQLPGSFFRGGSWSPDGSSITFTTAPPTRTLEIPAQGGEPRELLESGVFGDIVKCCGWARSGGVLLNHQTVLEFLSI